MSKAQKPSVTLIILSTELAAPATFESGGATNFGAGVSESTAYLASGNAPFAASLLLKMANLASGSSVSPWLCSARLPGAENECLNGIPVDTGGKFGRLRLRFPCVPVCALAPG